MTTKIHALVEGLGNLARFELTPGQVHDSKCADALLEELALGSLAADKAYDADALLDKLAQRGIKAVIPPRANRIHQREFDRHAYKHRNIIERFFCRIKQFRRIATRYDKLASRFRDFVCIAAAFIWLA